MLRRAGFVHGAAMYSCAPQGIENQNEVGAIRKGRTRPQTRRQPRCERRGACLGWWVWYDTRSEGVPRNKAKWELAQSQHHLCCDQDRTTRLTDWFAAVHVSAVPIAIPVLVGARGSHVGSMAAQEGHAHATVPCKP